MKQSVLIAYALLLAATFAVAAVSVTIAFALDPQPEAPVAFLVTLACCIAMVTVLFLATRRYITRPVETLAWGMHRVAHGYFDTKLDESETKLFEDAYADFNSMTDSLLNVEALRESFVSNVSHEFKTPLSYIQGYATLLQDSDLTIEERQEYITHICTATRRLSDMIGSLLEISNLSRPNSHIETAPFYLDEQIRHVIAIFIPQIVRKELSYDLMLTETLIDGNENLLEDAWTNLFSNAIKYTPTGGTISVTLERQEEHALVRVSDTGCGMSENQVAHAFDRFYQGDDSHKSEGNGLGLAIVRAVTKSHQGTLKIESTLGEGTTFTVKLPLKQHVEPYAE